MSDRDDEPVIGRGALRPGESIRDMAVSEIAPDPGQPRTHFDDAKVAALAQSMKADGLIQPIAVRPKKTEWTTADGSTETRLWRIIAGERRWRAARQLGWRKIQAIQRDFDDRQAAAASVIENTQREDLTVFELATYLKRLVDTWGYTHSDIAGMIGKDRTRVGRVLAVLDLPAVLHEYLRNGTLLSGHADLLGQLPGMEAGRLGAEAAQQGWSVRELGRQIAASQARAARGGPRGRADDRATDPNVVALTETLSEHFCTAVAVRERKRGKGGDLVIHFADNDVLSGILERMGLSEGD